MPRIDQRPQWVGLTDNDTVNAGSSSENNNFRVLRKLLHTWPWPLAFKVNAAMSDVDHGLPPACQVEVYRPLNVQNMTHFPPWPGDLFISIVRAERDPQNVSIRRLWLQHANNRKNHRGYYVRAHWHYGSRAAKNDTLFFIFLSLLLSDAATAAFTHLHTQM